MMVDPTMRMARELANEIGPAPQLPASLADPRQRVRLVETIERALSGRVDDASEDRWRASLGAVFTHLATDRDLLPDVEAGPERKSILLRLWSGCIAAAKTIALETRAGPNDEPLRTAGSLLLETNCAGDPIYKAGVEAAAMFKAGRSQKYSVAGLTDNVRAALSRVPEWEE
jgi:hypothetical protein